MKTLTVLLIISLVIVVSLMVLFHVADHKFIANNVLLLTIAFFMALSLAVISFLISFFRDLKEERRLFPTTSFDSSISDYQNYYKESY